MAKKPVESGEETAAEVTTEVAAEVAVPAGPRRWSCSIPSLGGRPLETEAETQEAAEAWFRDQVQGLDPQAKVSISEL